MRELVDIEIRILFSFVLFLSEIQRKARNELEPWLQTLHLVALHLWVAFIWSPVLGPVLNYSRQKHCINRSLIKPGGSLCHNIITISTRDGGLDWNTKMEKCLQEKQKLL